MIVLWRKSDIIQKDLKAVLYLFFVALFIRALIAAIIYIVLHKWNNSQVGPIIIPVQILAFKIPLFLFLYILFKMKKI